jgi:hypothetical protein
MAQTSAKARSTRFQVLLGTVVVDHGMDGLRGWGYVGSLAAQGPCDTMVAITFFLVKNIILKIETDEW